MANTTNFNWETPDDTDLVKDGAAAIRTLGSAIDTSLVDLKGGTTGQVLSKATNTDMDFTWVAQDDSNAIQNALLTTTGDTIYASGASTPARLGIGSTGQVLTVAGGVPSWATPAGGGGLELVLTQTIGSGVSSVVVSNAFSSTYDNYLVLISGGAASGNCNLTLQLGSTTSGYYWVGYYAVTSSASLTAYNGSNTANFSYAGIGSTNDINSITTIQAPNLAKRTHISTTSSRANSASNPTINRNEGFEDSNTQHTAFTIAPDSGTITGGTIKVYGYKN
jgi:hypothetical protein